MREIPKQIGLEETEDQKKTREFNEALTRSILMEKRVKANNEVYAQGYEPLNDLTANMVILANLRGSLEVKKRMYGIDGKAQIEGFERKNEENTRKIEEAKKQVMERVEDPQDKIGIFRSWAFSSFPFNRSHGAKENFDLAESFLKEADAVIKDWEPKDDKEKYWKEKNKKDINWVKDMFERERRFYKK